MDFWLICTYILSVATIPAMPDIPEQSLRNVHPVSKSFLASLQKGRLARAIPQISSRLRIIGGTEAKPNQFPYQVAIQVRNYLGDYDHHCGGVIYDSRHILTAAHCLRGQHPRNLKVIAGEHELRFDEGSEQYRDVLNYIYHPAYLPLVYDNDIGIITLDWPLDLNDKVRPLRIPSQIMELPKTARNSGWGTNGLTEGPQPRLLYVYLNVFTTEKCVQAYQGKALITEGMLCAGDDAGGRGSCSGDSGGPLVCADEKGSEYLCGLVSWGMIPCALPQYPTVFADINAYVDWLHALLPPQEPKTV